MLSREFATIPEATWRCVVGWGRNVAALQYVAAVRSCLG